jgi:four helix bundle protein
MKLEDKTLKFSVRVVNLCKYLNTRHKEFILSKQILRSGTNPGAMSREARQAQSKADFIHKYQIALKEIDETLYWLELLFLTGYIDNKLYTSFKKDATEILKMLISTIKTAKKNMSG